MNINRSQIIASNLSNNELTYINYLPKDDKDFVKELTILQQMNKMSLNDSLEHLHQLGWSIGWCNLPVYYYLENL